jgi:hypothetical protein
MYPWIVFLHVLGVFGFLMAHGISAGAAFALRRERHLERVKALLDLSSSSIGILHSSILILLLTGIITGFIGRWWGRGWIWLSLGLLIAIYVYMGIAASGFYSQVRKAVGLAYMRGFKPQPPGEVASIEEIDALLKRSRPVSLAVIGLVGLAIIAWLMMFKPF